MKLTWQSIRKSMDTQVNHAHMGIRTCIENNKNESVCVPGPRAATRYHEIGLVHNEYKI